jgi:hypothetical protein
MFSYENPYADRGSCWFKGNVHAHTTESDGHLSPEQLCEVYRRAGYDFLAVTDHDRLTDTTAYSGPDFLTLPGVEIGYPDHVVHLGAQSVNSTADMGQLLRELQREPGLAIVAHPHWSNMSWDRITAAEGYVGIEIYGYSPDINRGRGYAVQLWEMLLESGRRAWGFAVDDCHYNKERPNCGGGWIVVAANTLTQEDILDAIKKGAFYSSQGPSFYDVVTTDEGLYVRCSPVKVIRFISQTPGAGWSFHARIGERLDEMFVRWDGRRPRLRPNYVRLEIVDDAGRTAWSNPIYLSHLKGKQGLGT